MKENLTIQYKNVSDLIPYVNNARTHDDEQITQIASSIKEFGFNNPILIDEENGIIAGHGRLLAAKKLKLEKVPCVELSGLSESQKKAYVIADNKIALNSEWNEELLSLELKNLESMDFDLSFTGFSDSEMNELLSFQNPETDQYEDEIPESTDTSVTNPGDVWVMGNHRLICGDSCDAETIKRLMNGEKANLYLTDPPYNVNYKGKTKGELTILNDSMDNESFCMFLHEAFCSADALMHPGACFYIWHSDSQTLSFRSACQSVEWQIRECLIWVKNQMTIGRQDYQWRHEPCLYGWKSGASHKWYSDRSQTTILEFNKPTRNDEHPTMKPVDLFRYLIENSSKLGDVVLDSFGGSGTTLIACEQSGRKARISELDPKYCDVIVRRWQNLTGEKARLESSGREFDDVTN